MRKECVICKGAIEAQKTPDGKIFWGDGHHAQPVADGRCCGACNNSVVIPARLGQKVNPYASTGENYGVTGPADYYDEEGM